MMSYEDNDADRGSTLDIARIEGTGDMIEQLQWERDALLAAARQALAATSMEECVSAQRALEEALALCEEKML